MATEFDLDWVPQPIRSMSEIMDELFNMWIQDTTNCTFEEFCSL